MPLSSVRGPSGATVLGTWRRWVALRETVYPTGAAWKLRHPALRWQPRSALSRRLPGEIYPDPHPDPDPDPDPHPYPYPDPSPYPDPDPDPYPDPDPHPYPDPDPHPYPDPDPDPHPYPDPSPSPYPDPDPDPDPDPYPHPYPDPDPSPYPDPDPDPDPDLDVLFKRAIRAPLLYFSGPLASRPRFRSLPTTPRAQLEPGIYSFAA